MPFPLNAEVKFIFFNDGIRDCCLYKEICCSVRPSRAIRVS